MKLTKVNPAALRERLRQVREELAELEALEVVTSAGVAVNRRRRQAPTSARPQDGAADAKGAHR